MSVTVLDWLLAGWSIDARHRDTRDVGAAPSGRGATHEASEHAASLNAADQQLLARLHAGDVAAFETVYETYFTSVATFAQRFVHTREAAWDVTQDVFATIWERRTHLDVHGSLRSYLLAAARHRALDALRHARVVTNALEAMPRDEVTPLGMGAPHTSPDTLAEAHDLAQRVHAMLAALPERQRTAFILRWEHGLTNREIARILQIGDAAVSRLLHRAAETLSALL